MSDFSDAEIAERALELVRENMEREVEAGKFPSLVRAHEIARESVLQDLIFRAVVRALSEAADNSAGKPGNEENSGQKINF